MAQRQEAEEALRKSETRFRLLTENASDLISTHSPDGNFTYVSPSYEAILGYSSSELIGNSPFELINLKIYTY
jgi:PAS domain S-box-containing protein